MTINNSFQLLSFQRKVQDALQTVERTLELERKPQLASDVDHTYGAKYALVNLTSNTAIIAIISCLEKLGLGSTVLKSINRSKPCTLRFDASTTSKFIKEVIVDVPVQRSYEETETVNSKSKKGSFEQTKTKVLKAVNHVKEYHWEIETTWSVSIYSGTNVDAKKVIKIRSSKPTIITQCHMSWDKENLVSTPPIELSLTWLLQQIDTSTLSAQFKVDTEHSKTKTPRRNEAVSDAIVFTNRLKRWCHGIEAYFEMLGREVLEKHNPAVPDPSSSTPSVQRFLHVKTQHKIFNPILPLMDDVSEGMDEDDSNEVVSEHIIGLQTSNTNDGDNEKLLKSKDMSKLLNEHVRTLEVAINGVEQTWTSSGILSSTEATLVLVTSQLTALSTQYSQTMDYIESMMETSLITAIGKRVTAKDVATFVQYHEARLLSPKPLPFSHAIRRPEHYPVGLLTIESIDGDSSECIYTHTREVAATSSLRIPLNAATVLELTGGQYLHGYMNQRFGNGHKRHQLVARARQFSYWWLVI